MFHQETQEKQISRQVARMETWLAVWALNERKGSPEVGFMLSLVSQDQGALEASEAGL